MENNKQFKVKFETGQTVNFDKQPTPQDIEEVAQKLQINKPSQTQQQSPDSPKTQKQDPLSKAGKTLGSIFGGDVVGQALGDEVVKSQVRSGKFDFKGETAFSQASPEKQAEVNRRLQAKGVDTSVQGQREEIADIMKGPTKKQILGDVGQVGLTLGSLAVPVLKGSQVASKIPSLAGKGMAANLGRGATTLAANTGTAGVLGAGFGATQALKEGESVSERAQQSGLATGLVSGVLGLGGRTLKTVVPSVYKALVENFARVPQKAFDRFAENPQASRAALARAVNDDSMVFKIADNAQEAINNIQREKTRKFGQGLVDIGAETRLINRDSLLTRMQKTLSEDFKIVKNGLDNISNALPDDTERRTMKNIIDEVNRTPSDIPSMLNLKRFLQNQARTGTRSRDFKAIVTDMSNAIKKEMPDEVNKLLDEASATERLFEDVRQELKLERGGQGLDLSSSQGQVTVRKNTQRVIDALRRAFKKDETGAILLEELEKQGGKELIDDIAAQFFKDVLPPGGLTSLIGLSAGGIATATTALANPATLGVSLPLLASTGSPRIAGNIAIGAGQAKKAIEPKMDLLGRLGRTAIGKGASQN